jgi:predicted nucleic acid-binding protein
VTAGLALLDASAFWRLASPHLGADRRRALSDRIAHGIVAASTPLLLETRAGRDLPPADPEELPLLWITERAERRATDLQRQLRAAHQHLGVPSLDYLIAAIAEDHGATILHYDADFDRLATHADLAVGVEALAPLGTLP